ncbi:baculoviral IAP repeat-containing protein 7-like protein [Homarus gammarus nudivirus]|uniref:Baculoviral IAP repeat-containing protein 7-like protein n=1 Tax=Homarus gammarus nudivirus TaxID=2509616 RepID=A0A411HBD0_9VIRU|nr:baculoviral IAP repeat-containing protein 7-like protein [Homarus gammarus nudivirus]QBB28698.1 baculoviral IAP repeat-containing protein 7-like protein [Homarus gammarus nudivirus]
MQSTNQCHGPFLCQSSEVTPSPVMHTHQYCSPSLGSKSLLHESERLKTFKTWPLSASFISPQDLARNGFYYTKCQDHTACIFCHGIIGYWERGDVILDEHLKHFPHCEFAKSLQTGTGQVYNVGIEHNYDKVFNEHHEKLLNVQPRLPSKPVMSQVQRRQTFHRKIPDTWDESRIESFVKANFHYTGMSDMVGCDTCGGYLINWVQDEVPLIEHLRHFPHCSSLHQVTEIVDISKCHNKPTEIPALSDEDFDVVLDSPNAQELTGRKPGEDTVQAIRDFVSMNGYLCRNMWKLYSIYDY